MFKVCKRPILLLEVLIAIALVTLCILPLLAPHVEILREQQRLITHMKIDHQINLLYVDLLESLQKNEIAWGDLLSGRIFSVEEGKWNAADKNTLKVPLKVTYQFELDQHKPQKKKENGEWEVYVFKLIFHATSTILQKEKPLSFTYRVCVLQHHATANSMEAEPPPPPEPTEQKGKEE